MDRLIVTYALVQYCWSEGAGYLDCFWPFVIRAMPIEEKSVDLPYIRDHIKALFELDVPLHSLSAILRRAEQDGYVYRTPDQHPVTEKYSLTEKGLRYQGEFELESEVERRMAALIVDIRQFLDKEFEFSISEDDIAIALQSLIRKNMDPLIEFFNPSMSYRKPIRITKKLTRLGNCLARYMEIAEREKPDHYRTLRDIVLGAILTSVLNTKDISKITKGKALEFRGCRLFLDSNYILSVLGLHEKEFNEAAQELFSLLKSRDFDLKVFSFTVDEICRVMNGYITEGHKYPVSIAVENSIYSKLKRDGWTNKDVKAFIRSVEDRLKNVGIETEIITDVDIGNYVADESLRRAIAQRKPMQPLASQNHDLAAVDKIKTLRKHPVRRIANAKVLFLTSDRGLNKFDFIDMGHKANGTIGEVILDSLLTNIIWLSDPGANISLKSIIAVHSHGLFIKREVWLKFYEALKQIRQEGKANDDAISALFYDAFIEEELVYFDESQIDDIDQEFVLSKIEEAGKLAKVEREKREAELISHLTEAQTKIEEREQEFLSTLEAIKKKLRTTSAKTGSIMAIVYSILLSGGLIAACWFLCVNVRIQWVPDIAVAIIGGTGLGAVWSKFRMYCRRAITSSVYKKKLKEFGLDNINLKGK